MSWRRESTTPMEFEYDNGIGKTDPNSPFNIHSAKKRKLSGFAALPLGDGNAQQLNSGPSDGQTGTHSVFDSPSKNGFATPNRPHLREPHGEPFLFSQPRKLPQSIPPHVPNAWVPRTPTSIIDCSSGGETPNTPAQDSDAGTPDTQLASRMGGLFQSEKKSPKKSKRPSIISRIFSSSPSPSKEPPKDSRERERHYSKKAEHRVNKRRLKRSKAAIHDEYDSENEQDKSKDLIAQPVPPAPGLASNIPGVLAWVEAHPRLPAVLSYYMQFMINTALGIFVLWIIYAGYCAVMNDINVEADIKARDIMMEIAACTEHYQQNRCEPSRRLPALQEVCQQWERCMKRDAQKIARASVGARTFAMIFNSFVDEFSYKSMVSLALLLFLYVRRHAFSSAAAGCVHTQFGPPTENEYPQHHLYTPEHELAYDDGLEHKPSLPAITN